jgi:hypothetical protein
MQNKTGFTWPTHLIQALQIGSVGVEDLIVVLHKGVANFLRMNKEIRANTVKPQCMADSRRDPYLHTAIPSYAHCRLQRNLLTSKLLTSVGGDEPPRSRRG